MPREGEARQPLCADVDGFRLHAAVRVEAHDRKRARGVVRLTGHEVGAVIGGAAPRKTAVGQGRRSIAEPGWRPPPGPLPRQGHRPWPESGAVQRESLP